jgi:hypothetical protein
MERDELADRLSVELRRSFLYVKQYWEPDVTQLLLCGDMPEIRSLTAPLIDRLGIEVETLDTLEGIDPMKLPEPADRFSDQVAAFRLASAIAVEPLPVSLLASNEPTGYVNLTNRRLIAVGSAAAVAFAAFVYTRSGDGVHVDGDHGRPGGQIAAVQREPLRPQPASPASRSNDQVKAPTQGGASPASATPPADSASVARAATPAATPATTTPPAARVLPAEARVPSTEARVSPADARVRPPEEQTLRGEARPLRAANAAVATERRRGLAPAQRPALTRVAEKSPQQPDPVVRSILYSASRQVALIDGHIVRPGDKVGLLFVSAIEPDGVILTTPAGLRKRIGLDRPTVKIGRQ